MKKSSLNISMIEVRVLSINGDKDESCLRTSSEMSL